MQNPAWLGWQRVTIRTAESEDSFRSGMGRFFGDAAVKLAELVADSQQRRSACQNGRNRRPRFWIADYDQTESALNDIQPTAKQSR